VTWSDLERLYEEFAPMVRLAVLLTGSLAVAEDVVQEAFLRIAPRFTDLENPRAYLRTAVVNGCRTHQRDASRRRMILERNATERLYDDPRHVEFLDALKVLRREERTAIVLRYYEDLAEDDIAVVLSVAPATVRTLIRRGLEKLRKEVGR
jgi:RNA polymerase sigma factor (sigma-70 family)